jgi:glycolate oxidase iron-sulfur subunit
LTREFSKEELLQTILKCNRCGTCQDVCPTYLITGNETDVARSRIRLIRLVVEGKYKWGEDTELTDHLKSCLLCKACVTNCPSNVPTDRIMMHARNQINHAKGMPLFNRIAYRGIFSHSGRLTVLTKLLRFYQKSFASSLVRKSGFLRLLQNYGKAEALLPPIPAQSLKAQLPALLREIANPRHNIVYFAGCAINAFYGRFGIATIQVLQHNSCQVDVPAVVCCGGPHLSGGDFEEARRLARMNIDTVLDRDPDAVITDCATCSGIMKEYDTLFADDDNYRDKAKKFTAKIKDINEFLATIDLLPPQTEVHGTATFHDPCHLSRGQGITEAPRRLLQNIPGLQCVEMSSADMCCGGAGSYGALHPDTSRHILDEKMRSFTDCDADYLVTSCPACAMQLEFGLRRHKLKGAVVHPVELLARSYSFPQPIEP